MDHIPCISLSECEHNVFDYFSFVEEENDEGSFIRNVSITWLQNAKYIFGNEQLLAMQLCQTHPAGKLFIDFL